MKTRSFTLGCAAACCMLMVAVPVGRAAAIDDQQFKELKDLVTNLGQKLEKQDQRIDQLEKTHAQDALAHGGFRVRAYCPVGDLVAGMAYLVRRLLENTSNESFLHEAAAGVPLEQLLAAP